ncbi:GMC oxidoreductase [Cereibacter azotoformans]|uniref:GMC oxidoreductase n=1 Tax=Cereibacter azotoformans TaxID=43057 RepID=UPI002E25F858|nr:GMC oxidoreductase [Cereibacter azotoformans]
MGCRSRGSRAASGPTPLLGCASWPGPAGLSLPPQAAPFEEFSSADAFSSTHVFGTCRMGHDPMRNVVDGWGRSHVADASLFPSNGGGESPGLTIQALALRTADHLLSEARP